MSATASFQRHWKRIVMMAALLLLLVNFCLVYREARMQMCTKPTPRQKTNENYRGMDTNSSPDFQPPPAVYPTSASLCQPKHRFVFIKIHKTGSSTVTTTLERYGYRRDLNFALPASGLHFFPRHKEFHTSYIYCWGLQDGNGTPVWPALGGFQVLVNHVRYNRSVHSTVVPKAFYFTIIREPVSRFESFFNYFRFDRDVPSNSSHDPIEVFLRNPIMYNSTVNIELVRFFRNGQLYMLGLEPSSYEDLQAVEDKIKSLSREIDLVMITEYFDESLVLLKKLMCWDFQDIVYISKGVRNQISSRNITTGLRIKIENWNRADVKLYQRFNVTFWEKVKSYGADFHRDLQIFRELRAAVKLKCLANGTSTRDLHNANHWKLPVSASEKCQDLTREDTVWTHIIRKRMEDKSRAFINYTMG